MVFRTRNTYPLENLGLEPEKPWYIVVDALDECANDKAEVLNILKSKVRRLPNWLKLILSSRNVSTITASFNGLKIVELRSDDTKNLNDIDTYLSFKVFSWKDSLVHKIKTNLAITNNEAPAQKIVSILTERGQGNFLFVKVMLDLWMASTQSASLDAFPQTLDTIYQLYFERKYATPESFQPLRAIFEVLVAAYTHLTIHEMHLALKLGHPALDLEYDLMPKLDLVSLFLWHGSGEDLIRIHHASLSEWLTSDKNKGKFYYIKKQNGHNRLAKYYLKKAEESNFPLKPDRAFYLASHIVEGGLDDPLVEQFLSLPSSHINSSDPSTQMTALHHSSCWFNADVTKLLVGHFSDVDSVDYNQRTPAFIAATSGYLKNLKILFGRGANLNRRAAYLDFESASHSKNAIKECRRKLCGYSLLHTAAQKGNNDVVAFLIQHKVNIFSTTGANNTALQLAAANGHLETLQILQSAGGELDDISLHHAAAGGHNEVVQYLLGEGVVDDCVQNIPFSAFPNEDECELESKQLRLYDDHHLHLRETALHAAVAQGHVDVIKTLMSQDQNAINCPNSATRLPLHEAVYANNYNILETLLKSGGDANVHCDDKMLSSSTGSFTEGTMLPTRCPCGFAALHIAAKHGYHSVTELLIKNGADPDTLDCNGSTPLHIASCHNMPSLVTLLVSSGADIDARSLNGSTPLHSAASCFSKDIFGLLFDLGCDYQATDGEGMTALHYVIKDITHVGSEYFADLYVNNPKGWIEKHSGASQNIVSELDIQYPWLNTMIELVKLVSKKEKANKIDTLAMQDRRNRTVFHILEEKTSTSNYLTGSSCLRENCLVLSLTPFVFSYDVTISERLKNHVVALNKPYEQALVATSLKRVISRAYTSTFTKLNCSYLLKYVRLRFVYTANTLLQAGVDVNCRDASGLTPLLVYLRIGSRHMSKVLVKHNVKVDITCRGPFEDSVFHLASYHKLHYLHYLYEYLRGSDNWKKYLQTENAFFDYFLDKYEERIDKGNLKTIKTGDGPLTLAILSHPDGSNVLDECFDAEGYNALHRAAQGANLAAIEKFISLGANLSIQTHDGSSPLWLSVLYAVKYRPFLNLEVPGALTALEVEFASLSASTILNHLLKDGTLDIGCSEKRSDLTLYHVAATRGMWQFIAHLLSSGEIIGVDVDCPNKDGITPMYLALFIGGDSCEWHSPWCKVVDVIKSYGGTLRYPSLEAEYFLIYNIFFGLNPSKLFLELTQDEIQTLQEGYGRDECRKYRAKDVNLSKTFHKVDRIRVNFQKEVDKCSSFIKDCPADIKRGLPHFTFVVFFLDRQQALKLNFLHTRNSLVNFLDDEMERLKKLLFVASRPHAQTRCAKAPKDYKPKEDTIDMCYQFRGKQNLETLLHKFYRIYKERLDLVLEKSDEMRSHMPFNGKLPRFLSKMNFALADYDTSLNCDWQAIAIKYVQLSFQVRNLNYWIQATHETFTVPSVSGFLSKRMENAILQHSEESLKLVLKLASGHPTETFNYLRTLRFTRPPLWDETFSGEGNFGQSMGP